MLQMRTDKPAFYIEMITLNRVEFDKSLTLLITALIIIGAGLLTGTDSDMTWQQKTGAGVAFLLFSVLFLYRLIQCWLSIRFATKQLVEMEFIEEYELQGVRLGKWQLARYFLLAWFIPIFATIFVLILVFID